MKMKYKDKQQFENRPHFDEHYCRFCGKENHLIDSCGGWGDYDCDSGKRRKMYSDCPVQDCGHGYCKYEKLDRTTMGKIKGGGLINKFMITTIYERCKICGYIFGKGYDLEYIESLTKLPPYYILDKINYSCLNPVSIIPLQISSPWTYRSNENGENI
jgi:hypothetical protein